MIFSVTTAVSNGFNICFTLLDIGEKAKREKNATNRNKLLMAARNGDENAIESLTLDDIDTYAQLSKKIR